VTRTISVVIPTLDNDTLVKALEAVLGQTRQPDEIVVVGRYDKMLSEAFPQVRFVDTQTPVCAAAARNRGITASRGDIVAFTDSDCIPAEDWLDRLEHAHASGAEVVGGGVSLAGANFWAQSDNVAMFHDFISEHPPGLRLLLPTLNLSVRRSVIAHIGLLDESFPGAAAEDSDWTIRMRLAGYALHFDPTAVVRHAPNRVSWRDIRRHWRNSGYSGIRVRHRYAAEYQTPAFARSALLMRVLSPFIAARITFGIYANRIFWRHLHYLPIVYATKVIYCFGAAASIESGFAFDNTVSGVDYAPRRNNKLVANPQGLDRQQT